LFCSVWCGWAGEPATRPGEADKDRLDPLPARLAAKRGVHPRIYLTAARWRNAVALSWAGADAPPAKVALKRDSDVWRFAAGDRTATLDWKTGEAKQE